MNAHAEVTVICATRNAREAVRLTFSSFHRYTPERCTVLVADNGSTDGALDVLRRFPWIKVFSLRERRALVRAQSMQSHQAIAALNARLDRSVGSLPGTERALLISALTTQVHELDILPESNGQGASTGHGVTLDWLAEKVTTPFLLTLDSDVEFLATGWLREMLNLLKRASLTALGEYEPGVCGYRSRLAPHLLLLRTSALHTHHWSFRGFVSIEDPDEAKRWRARPKSPNLDAEEAATHSYPGLSTPSHRAAPGPERWRDLPRQPACSTPA